MLPPERLVNRGLREKHHTTPIWSPLTEGASGKLGPTLIACPSYFDWVGHQGPRRLNRKISISLCPYSATDGSSAKHFTVTLKPNNIFQGKWLANSHHLWCRKIPTSFSDLNASKETPQMKESLQPIWFFFHSPFVEISFTQGLKEKKEKKNKKKKKQRKRKPALNEKFQSCLCKNPPSPGQLPLPLYPGLRISRQRG